MKTLLLDIETSPNLAHVWALKDTTVGLNQLLEASSVICWAAKWLGEPDVFCNSQRTHSKAAMLTNVFELLDRADAVVHYNGCKFDIPTLNKEFFGMGWPPPSPSKNIDLYQTVKANFKLPSNKLAYVLRAFGFPEKLETGGHELWIGCLNGDEQSWLQMESYNKQDVAVLEPLYLRLRPWIRNHPNVRLYDEIDGLCCPTCGGKHSQKRGQAISRQGVYQRYICLDCGTWYRDKKKGDIVKTELETRG